MLKNAKKMQKYAKICKHELYMQNTQKFALTTLLMTRSGAPGPAGPGARGPG